MSPTVFKEAGFRFHFFSREEPRLHVHVLHSTGEAKFWIEPTIELAMNSGLSDDLVAKAERLIRGHEDEIRSGWAEHFPG